MSEPKRAQRVECIIPILNVRHVPASVRFYVDMLGFELQWGEGEESTYASVGRDGCSIMLAQGGQGHSGTWIWIGVEDVQAIFEQCLGKGAKIVQGLTNYPWAYEMRIEDLDGHILRIGSEPRADLPIEA